MRTLPNQLAQLEQSGLIRIAQLQPEIEYLFRHALVQDASYQSILKRDRIRLHGMVGEIIERLHADQPEKAAAVLAPHFQLAGDAAKALYYFTLAADLALATYANSEAEQHYRSALEFVSEEMDRAVLLDRLGQSIRRQGRLLESVDIWQEAIPLYLSLGDTSAAGQVYANISRNYWDAGDWSTSRQISLDGLAALGDAPESAGLAALLEAIALSHYRLYQYEEHLDYAQQALVMAKKVGAAELEASIFVSMAGSPLLSVENRRVMTENAVEIAEAAGHLRVAARAHYNLGVLVTTRITNSQDHYPHYVRASELNRQLGDRFGEFLSTLSAHYWSLLMGKFLTAENHFAALCELMKGLEPQDHIADMVRTNEALRCQLLGEVDEAIRLIQMNVERAHQHTNRTPEYFRNLWLTFGTTLFEQGSFEAAAESLLKCLAIYEAHPRIMDHGVTVRAQLARIRLRQGRIDEAEALLAEAYAVLAEPIIDKGVLMCAEAELSAAKCNWDRALADYEAWAGFERGFGRRYWAARVLLDWAEVYLARRAEGDRDRALDLLQQAYGELMSMGVSYYADRVQQQIEALGANLTFYENTATSTHSS